MKFIERILKWFKKKEGVLPIGTIIRRGYSAPGSSLITKRVDYKVVFRSRTKVGISYVCVLANGTEPGYYVHLFLTPGDIINP